MTKTLFDAAWDAKFLENTHGPDLLIPDFVDVTLTGNPQNAQAQGNNKNPSDPPGMVTISNLIEQLTDAMADPQSKGSGTPMPQYEGLWWKPAPPGQAIPGEIYWKNVGEPPPWAQNS